MTRKLSRLLLASSLLIPAGAVALGVGRIEVRSALNQALDAEIELVSVGGDEFSNLTVGLASSQTFSQAGLDRPSWLSDLRFSVQPREGGGVVKVTSSKPIREPVLDLLVEFTWPKGRLMREFAILLDPPTTALRGPVPPLDRALTVAAAPTPRPAAPPKPELTFSGKTYGPVAHGETLWVIASQVRPDPSISIQQMMDALLQANPRAFSKANINHLLAGATLRIPNIGKAGAPQAGQPEPKPPTAQVRLVPPEATEKPAAAPARTAAAPEAPLIAPPFQIKLQNGQLRLRVAGIDDLSSRVGVITPTPAQESVKPSGVPQEKTEVAAPEVQEPRVAAETTGMSAAGFQEATPGVTAPPASLEETPAAGTPPAVEPPQQTAAGTPQPSPSTAVAPVQPAKPSQPVVKEPPPAQPSLLMDTLTALFKDPKMLTLGGFVVALLIALTTLLVRRRSAEEELAEDLAILPSTTEPSTAKPRSTRTAPSFGPVSKPSMKREPPTAPSGVPSESRSVPSFKPASSPNPLERADLLIAVGGYAEAQNVLRRALQVDPTNVSLMAKLLDVHYAAGNKEGFLQAAQNLRAKLDNESDPRWLHAVQMGRELVGTHPLFGAAKEPETTEPATGPTVTVRTDVSRAEEATRTSISRKRLGSVGGAGEQHAPPTAQDQLSALDQQTVPLLHEEPATLSGERDTDKVTGLEWQLPDEEPVTYAGGQRPAKEADMVLEWQLPDEEPITYAGDRSVKPTAKSGEPPSEELQKLDLEFDSMKLETTGSAPVIPVTAVEPKRAEDQLEALDFDLEKTADIPTGPKGGQESALTPEDYVETKLDLALAYLDMGDQEGARSLLEEVLKEGNAEQKQRAQTHVARLG